MSESVSHMCDKFPSDMPGCTVSITRGDGEWELSTCLYEANWGTADARFTIVGIKHCPWCGQRLGESDVS